MPIANTDYGTHKNVLFFDFGNGDILITEGKALDNPVTSQLIFSEDTPHQIGEITEKYKGLLSDEIPDIKMVFDFKSVESIDVIISKLEDLKRAMILDYDTHSKK